MTADRTPDTHSNVLILMSDEHQSRALGSAGHPVVQTPNLDALAGSGTRFTNCWTPSPICVSARGSFATGRWVHDIGTWDSAQAYAGIPQGWTHEMRDAGYDIVSFGKLHHRSEADDDGFSERFHPMYIAGGIGWVQGLPREHPLPYDEAIEFAQDVGVGHTTYTRYDERVTNTAVDWISKQDGSRPWVSFVSLVAPHYPLSAPEEFSDLYKLSDIPPPEIPEVAVNHPAVAAIRDFFSYHEGFDSELTQRARHAYYALCSSMDYNFGRVIAALEASGQREDTLIIYTSDHGEMLGNRGLWAKSFMYEDSVAVPMIISGPGVPANSSVATNVSLTDVADTVTRTKPDSIPDGTSLVDLANAGDDIDRLGFSEYHDGGSITGSFAIRWQDWKYIEHVGYDCQLFNMEEDPHELNDLGVSSGTAGIRAQCAEALRSIVDPEMANAEAFATQARLLDLYGGRDGVAERFRFNHTPAPD